MQNIAFDRSSMMTQKDIMEETKLSRYFVKMHMAQKEFPKPCNSVGRPLYDRSAVVEYFSRNNNPNK